MYKLPKTTCFSRNWLTSCCNKISLFSAGKGFFVRYLLNKFKQHAASVDRLFWPRDRWKRVALGRKIEPGSSVFSEKKVRSPLTGNTRASGTWLQSCTFSALDVVQYHTWHTVLIRDATFISYLRGLKLFQTTDLVVKFANGAWSESDQEIKTATGFRKREKKHDTINYPEIWAQCVKFWWICWYCTSVAEFSVR